LKDDIAKTPYYFFPTIGSRKNVTFDPIRPNS